MLRGVLAVALAVFFVGGNANAGGLPPIPPPPPIVLTPPLAYAKIVAALGDSYMANAGLAAQSTGGNWISWALLYSNRSLNMPAYNNGYTTNCGVGGYKTDQMVANLPCVFAARPDVVLFGGGTNDVQAGTYTCAQIVKNKRTIYQALQSAGIYVISVSIIPRAAPSAWSVSASNIAQCVNEQDRRWAATQGNKLFTFIDLDPVVIDTTQTALWTIQPGLLDDGIHPNLVGGSIIGYAVAKMINQLVYDWRRPVMSIGDTYDATNNPYGNLIYDGLMLGTSGGNFISSCTGVFAGNSAGYNWLQGTPTPGTCVASIGTLPDGRKTQQIIVSGAASGSNQFIGVIAQANWAQISVGDTIEGQAYVCLSGTIANISGVALRMKTTEGGSGFSTDTNVSTLLNDSMAATGFADGQCHLITTPTRTMTGAVTGAYLYFQIQIVNGSVNPTGTVQVTSMSIKKVVP